MNLKQRAREYFASHTTVNEFFFTSDGLAFFNPADAEAHAPSLGDKTIEKIIREDAEDEPPAASATGTPAVVEAAAKADTEAAKKATKTTTADKKAK